MKAKHFISFLFVLTFCTVTFSQSYNYAPNGVITPNGISSTNINYLIDNNESATYCTNGTSDPYLFIDLQHSYTITAIEVKASTTFSYQIAFGNIYDPTSDGCIIANANSNSIITVLGNFDNTFIDGGQGPDNYPGSSFDGQYFAFIGIPSGVCISEIKIYGSVPPTTYYNLTTSTTPAGGGTIGLSPTGGSYSAGQTVTAIAKPALGYIFKEWSNAATGSANTLAITMDANKTLTATFETATELWKQTGTSIYYNNTGNVGIGTLTPGEKLEVNGNVKAVKFIGDGSGLTGVSGSSQWTPSGSNIYFSKGSVAVGTNTPRALFDVSSTSVNTLKTVLARLPEGDGTGEGTYLGVKSYNTQPYTSNSFAIEFKFYGQTNSSINFYRGGSYTGGYLTFNTDNNTERMRITPSGNVLIGKTSQTNTDYKLDVAGKIRADEVVVNTTGADFVFEKNYKLRPLSEVETFIKQNKHLPNVAPAAEMQANGVSMGDMQAKLLQKVEELTLYVIELKKENTELKSRLDRVEKDNNKK